MNAWRERLSKLMDHAANDALIGRYRQRERIFAKSDATARHVAGAAVAAPRRAGVDIVTIVTRNPRDS